jgi:hypothetical protein
MLNLRHRMMMANQITEPPLPDLTTEITVGLTSASYLAPTLTFYKYNANYTVVDWGDGSATTKLATSGNKALNHVYSGIGTYIIKIFSSGNYGLSEVNGNSYLLGSTTYNAFISNIVIYDKVTALYKNALKNAKITNLLLPSSVTSIGEYCFASCTNLTSVTIPSSVTILGDISFEYNTNVFDRTNNLAAINVDSNNSIFCSIDNVLFDKGITRLIKYAPKKTATTYSIPTTVSAVNSNSFNYATALTKVYFPISVLYISASSSGYSPFLGCLSSLALRCKATSKPSGWGTYWRDYDLYSQLSVTWNVSS